MSFVRAADFAASISAPLRRGSNRASVAVASSILTAAWHMLSTGELYHDPGGDYFARKDPERTARRLVAQLEKLGHTVTLQPKTPTPPEALAA